MDYIWIVALGLVCIAGFWLLAGDTLTRITAFLGTVIVIALLVYGLMIVTGLAVNPL